MACPFVRDSFTSKDNNDRQVMAKPKVKALHSLNLARKSNSRSTICRDLQLSFHDRSVSEGREKSTVKFTAWLAYNLCRRTL